VMMIRATLYKKPFFNDYSGFKEAGAKQFLYVKRNSVNLSPVSEDYLAQNTVHNLDEAKSYLKEMQLSELPELIILDLPLNLKELIVFKNWVTQNLIPPIPIIYKECFLNPVEIKKIFELNLVDDVIKCDRDSGLLYEKVKFFKSLAVESLIDPTPVEKAGKINKPLHRIFIKRALIKLTSKGPILYKSKRAGEGFKVFDFYKFRTMVAGAEELLDSLHVKNMYNTAEGNPCFFKVSNDPRVTKIGLFLRNTSLDELPQLFNVLKGDMSLVGNRPLPLYEATTLTTREWAERFMAPAGITGLWQISKRGKPKMSAEERISLDIAYARSSSTRRDLKILLATPSAIVQKQSQ
jgi:lipopolysaccharide/colanic/teichoic acid biosynthesis glycosyltransferase